ncbi:uncharacterized protein LOC135218826 [Macrobrachium nipponense]|uniref:uncharacterized protein LOC135218826 n=1 Tax=Macrobrachium nipponense TaxID=159736 RepID=UPI0030C88D8A
MQAIARKKERHSGQSRSLAAGRIQIKRCKVAPRLIIVPGKDYTVEQTTIKLGGGNINRGHKFKYLGSVVGNEGNMEINNRIQCGWNNWRKVPGVIYDRKVPITLKGRVHKAVVRPAMTYGLEAAPLKKTGQKVERNRDEDA